MIAYLKGNYINISPSKLIIDVNGVGYEVQISLNTYIYIKDLTNGLLYTYLHINDNGQTLFGFPNEAEKELFLNLISVSGVGANTARMIQSGMKSDEIIHAITNANVLQLEKIKGIGKKTAERIVLELKDKLYKIQLLTSSNSITQPSNVRLKSDALQALMALGINRINADKAIEKIMTQSTAPLDVENLIKNALKIC
ncbi:MAG: Holliday junction branch migration protein RuvA [Sediminibacterium sp.]|nr:Holliday junction branch migration protein RuvA [Sediminibacterium sp.]